MSSLMMFLAKARQISISSTSLYPHQAHSHSLCKILLLAKNHLNLGKILVYISFGFFVTCAIRLS